MVPYLVITQAVSVVGLVHGIWVYGFANFWATVAFAALGASSSGRSPGWDLAKPDHAS